MSPQPRVFVEGGLCHAYNRLARGAEIFREGDEDERCVELLRRACERDEPGFVVAGFRRSRLAMRGSYNLWHVRQKVSVDNADPIGISG